MGVSIHAVKIDEGRFINLFPCDGTCSDPSDYDAPYVVCSQCRLSLHWTYTNWGRVLDFLNGATWGTNEEFVIMGELPVAMLHKFLQEKMEDAYNMDIFERCEALLSLCQKALEKDPKSFISWC